MAAEIKGQRNLAEIMNVIGKTLLLLQPDQRGQPACCSQRRQPMPPEPAEAVKAKQPHQAKGQPNCRNGDHCLPPPPESTYRHQTGYKEYSRLSIRPTGRKG
ncbi:hypothetical protein N6L27_04705 [Leisingera sp. SS27]|uniref:hypothetical protein n=1 Tax=Leisingera sp. SS27 TaxID=2979462 RepID=UPI00232A9119|nr:hypothetical protein [Leisingera sp. SS27]MDC0657293.1 hypothetical protein [Leisingera sp. SS27]